MRSVVLFSGGLDSTVCLVLSGYTPALLVNYGQPHWAQERHAAGQVLQRLGGPPLYMAMVTLPGAINRSDPAMLVPGRNIVLLSLAATMADRVIFGANADDHDGYPDCRPEFFAAAQPALGVKIETPLLHMTKPEIGALARDIGVPVDETWSCYYPMSGAACGECDACRHRAEALA